MFTEYLLSTKWIDSRLAFQACEEENCEFPCALSQPHHPLPSPPHTHTCTQTHNASIWEKFSITSIPFWHSECLLCLSLGCAHPQERSCILSCDMTIPRFVSLGMPSTNYCHLLFFKSCMEQRFPHLNVYQNHPEVLFRHKLLAPLSEFLIL